MSDRRAQSSHMGYDRPYRDPSMTPAQVLGQYGTPGEIEQVLLHPRAADHARRLYELAADADWELALDVDDPTPEETSWAQYASHALLGIRADAVNGVGTLGDIMGQAATGRWYGHALWEVRWDGEVWEAYEVHQSSVSEVVMDGDGRVTAVRQQTWRGAAVIDREHLAWISYGTWPYGAPALRPLVRWMGLVASSIVSAGARTAADAGTVMIGMKQGSSELAQTAARSVTDAISATGTRVVVVGDATGVDSYSLSYASGGAVDYAEQWRYVDAVVDHAMLGTLDSLGGTAGSGSRALGEAQGEADTDRVAAWLAWLGRAVSSEILGVIARETGYEGRLPVLRVRQASVEQTAAERVAAYVSLAAYLPRDASERAAVWLASQGGIPQEVLVPERTVDADVTSGIEMARHDHVCACHMSRPSNEVLRDAWGDEYHGCKSLADMTPAERSVRWGRTEDAYRRIRARLLDQIDGELLLMEDDLQDILGSARPGAVTVEDMRAQVDEAAALYREAVRHYILEAAHAEVAVGSQDGESSRQAQEDAGQLRIGSVNGIGAGVLGEVADAMEARLAAQVETAADAIIGRVVGELMGAWSSGAPMGHGWKSRQTAEGLANEASGALSTAEDTGRLAEAAADASRRGLVVIRVSRTSVRDEKRCDVCAERDGIVWDVDDPDGATEFIQDPRRILPDPACEGGAHCRCSLIVEWGRHAEEAD